MADNEEPPAEEPETGRSSSLWIGVGITATPEEARRRRMSKQRESVELSQLAPGTRVMFLLKEKEEVPSIFTEMGELSDKEWRETARWVKFEEDVESGGNRWSKPHVATLSLHSLFELRSCLNTGVYLRDYPNSDLDSIYEAIADEFLAVSSILPDMRDELLEVLHRKHVHQYEQAKKNGAGGEKAGGFLSTVRSISDIGKSLSHGKNLGKTEERPVQPALSGPNLELPKVESLPKDMQKDGSSLDISKGNTHFLKKLPVNVHACNVLIGEVDFLTHHISAFIRLKEPTVLGDMTEVPVPTKFIFLLLGPRGNGANYREIGRAIATLMADEIFHSVAYNAQSADDLLAGVDEFLDQATVLPPGEWDPNIRIEPPNQIPSQEKRKQQGKELLLSMENVEMQKPPKKDEIEEEEGHGNDPALKRTGRYFGGLMLDIKRKAPHYVSDFTDAFNMQCLATVCFMYFALLAPIVTFGGLLEEATHQRMAAMENLFGGSVCGILYHLLAGQPLTIIGSTGPVLVFETIVFDMCTRMGFSFLSFRLWIYLWTALILFITVVTDMSSMVSYITRFTEESFACLIAVIFIYEAIMKLWKIKGQNEVINFSRTVTNGTCYCVPPVIQRVPFSKAGDIISKQNWTIPHNETFVDYTQANLAQCQSLGGGFEGNSCYELYDRFLMSVCLAVGTFFLAITLKKMRNSCYFPSKIRQVASDFAVMIAICLMTALDHAVGVNTPKLYVPHEFRPTWEGRGWFIPLFDGNPYWSAGLAILPAMLACILIFMDQQITTVIVNRKENKLKKGCGYHLDLMVLSCLIVLNGIMGLPVFVAATVLALNHINSLKMESECQAPGEVAQFVGVREQRLTGIVTFILLGFSVMFTKVLGLIPMPVLYGVFLFMGVSPLGGIQLFDRFLLFLMPMKYQPDTIYIRHVPITRIHLFTVCQLTCFALLWTVKSIKATSIFFPVMLLAMVAVRKLIERFFTASDLKYLDDPMPDFHLRKKEDLKRRQSEAFNGDDIELEENQATIHAVKTEAHLHIPMASGNVIKIPLAAIQEPSHSINMTKEVNSSGIYKHIQYNDSKASLGSPRSQGSSKQPDSAPLESPEEDEDAIMIKVIRPSPHGSNTNISESQPLLKDKDKQNPV